VDAGTLALPVTVGRPLFRLATAGDPGDVKLAEADVLVAVTLGAGRTLTVRPVTADDADGLGKLFDGLSQEDKYYRFFNFSCPGRRFIEQMTRAEEDGGYRLVAVLSGPTQELVAEAGYVLLPDGNGEFALTVAAAWRGWLGPYLLDALVAAAAARGVPNLQADILSDNTRMLALAEHRGYATLEREFGQLRIAVDAARPRPQPRPRPPAGAGQPRPARKAAALASVASFG
jgi:RimJ/RimL family protein N-acetyltransferase